MEEKATWAPPLLIITPKAIIDTFQVIPESICPCGKAVEGNGLKTELVLSASPQQLNWEPPATRKLPISQARLPDEKPHCPIDTQHGVSHY